MLLLSCCRIWGAQNNRYGHISWK